MTEQDRRAAVKKNLLNWDQNCVHLLNKFPLALDSSRFTELFADI